MLQRRQKQYRDYFEKQIAHHASAADQLRIEIDAAKVGNEDVVARGATSGPWSADHGPGQHPVAAGGAGGRRRGRDWNQAATAARSRPMPEVLKYVVDQQQRIRHPPPSPPPLEPQYTDHVTSPVTPYLSSSSTYTATPH